jgi:hypothetical protein
MRIYLAGYYNGKASVYSLQPDEYAWLLESYHYINGERYTTMIRRDKPRKIFLDSGAYSAFSKGAKIHLDRYAEYIERNQDIIQFCANLDDLARDKEAAAKNSADNLKELEKLVPKGMYVMPVYHCREDPKWLRAIIGKYEYIALGGMVPESSAFLRVWLDEVWGKYLVDKKGEPTIKVHGFGLTAFDLMQRYPWYSVDSTSWVLTGRFGSILTWSDDGRIIKTCISSESPRRRDWDRHFDTLAPPQQAAFSQLVEDRGYKIDELRTVYWKRDLWNIDFFKSLMKLPAARFRLTQPSLFEIK